MIKASQLLAKCLENEGVKYVFGVPGEENLAFLEALRESSIEFVVTHTEQAAVFMAATVGRLTGKMGVALSTLGPGATNLVTGVAYAQLGGMPVMVITGQKPILKSKQGKFQIIDVVRMMEPITKYSTTIFSVDRIPSIVREAVRQAESERPGAVHLELPEDIAELTTELVPLVQEKARRPGPDPKSISEVVSAIESAKHPIIIIAAGANRKLIRKQLKSFLAKTQIPFVTTQMGKGVEDESSDLYIGTTALSSGDFVHSAIESADCVILLGHDTSEKPPALFNTQKHKLIHLNFYPADIDAVYVPQYEVIGDVSHSLWMMTEKITTQGSWDFSHFYKAQKALRENITENASDDRFPILPQRLVCDLRSVMSPNSILSLDNGMYKIWIARNYPSYEQNSILLDNALATMGAGLSAGITAKILNPDKDVLVIAGDGGFMMNIAELETAKRLGISLVVLILNDSGFGMIKWKQQDMHLPAFGLDFQNPDFVKLAESFGVHGHRVSQVDDLKNMIAHAFKAGGVHVIDCPVDYTHNHEALGVELKAQLKKI